MKGTRPLTLGEIRKVARTFEGRNELRDRSLFILGINTGGRISELLSLKIGDVFQNNKPVTDLQFSKHQVKGKENARTIPLNSDGRQAVRDLIRWHRNRYGRAYRDRALFASQYPNGAMSRRNAHDILKAAFLKAGLNGKLATHSMRKTFAQRLYNATGDIFIIKELLGHKSVNTTQDYLGFNYDEVRSISETLSGLLEGDEDEEET
ncbi:MAG: tyrosine-type recombinase/integrase [Acidimicrobiaceae bacterium]|nr:tyrosine-type recombinase/integrase [Candidatus Poribacteria bacterium]MYI34865.1 tyrosine-type recombinase/integrase [Acidimicrobiaceae bacterium]